MYSVRILGLGILPFLSPGREVYTTSAMAPDAPGFGMLLRLVSLGPAYNGQGGFN